MLLSSETRKIRFRLLNVILLVAILSLLPVQLFADEIDESWASIVESYQLGDYEAVIDEAANLFSMVEPFADLYLIRAIALRDTGNFNDAFLDFDAAAELEPQDGYIYFHRGYAHLMLNSFEEAVSDLSRAIEFIPGMYEAWWNRGIAYNWLGNNKDALYDLNKAIELIPQQNPYLHRDRGVVLNEIGLYSRALGDYNIAIDLYADEPLFYAERGLVLQSIGNDEAAIADFDTAILLRNDPNADDFYNRGISLAKLLRFSEAFEDFNSSLAIEPEAVDSLNNRAWCSIQLESYDAAIEDCTAAVVIDPGYPVSYFNRAAALERLGEYASAIADYESAVQTAMERDESAYSGLITDAREAVVKLQEYLASQSE